MRLSIRFCQVLVIVAIIVIIAGVNLPHLIIGIRSDQRTENSLVRPHCDGGSGCCLFQSQNVHKKGGPARSKQVTLIKLTVSPLYQPRIPSLLQIMARPRKTPLYSGMLVWMYLVRVGPCTCNRFRTRSSGKTAVFAKTLAKTPAVASPEPNGKVLPPIY